MISEYGKHSVPRFQPCKIICHLAHRHPQRPALIGPTSARLRDIISEQDDEVGILRVCRLDDPSQLFRRRTVRSAMNIRDHYDLQTVKRWVPVLYTYFGLGNDQAVRLDKVTVCNAQEGNREKCNRNNSCLSWDHVHSA